jgi:hypothetical protein
MIPLRLDLRAARSRGSSCELRRFVAVEPSIGDYGAMRRAAERLR